MIFQTPPQKGSAENLLNVYVPQHFIQQMAPQYHLFLHDSPVCVALFSSQTTYNPFISPIKQDRSFWRTQ